MRIYDRLGEGYSIKFLENSNKLAELHNDVNAHLWKAWALEANGKFDEAEKFYDELKLFKRLVNIGDAKSLACHPASTTHRQMTTEEQAMAGVTEDLLRLCVGIEHNEDIIADLDQAFGAVK